MILLMLDDPGINTLYTMPTYDLIRLRAMPGVEEDLRNFGLKYEVNKSEYFIKIAGYGTMFFRSYERPERIVSFECAHSICDELDTLPKEKAKLVWRKVSERTRQKSKRPNSIANVTTPDMGINGFTYEKWVKQAQAGYELIKASTLDNFYLPDTYVQQIRDNYDDLLAELYLRGEFVSLSDKKVYHFFDRKKHHTNRVITDMDVKLYIGIDFNIGGCVAVVFVIENNCPIAVDEFVSHDSQDIHNNIVSRYLKNHPTRKVIIYPDASGNKDTTNATASDINIVKGGNDRISQDSPNANPRVRDRINAVNKLLSHDELKVNTDKCPEFTFALESQGYTDKNEPEKFNEHPSIDDWIDAPGYFLHRKFPVIKPISPFTVKFGV